MDGGDRAGYKQISEAVDAVLLTSTSGPTTGDWTRIRVLNGVQIASVTAAGLTGSSLITSATTYAANSVISCAKITAIDLSTDTAGQVIMYSRALL